jgi:hypothetical protein
MENAHKCGATMENAPLRASGAQRKGRWRRAPSLSDSGVAAGLEKIDLVGDGATMALV